ncbi:MAG: ATP synthase F1 subunit delta [Thermoguttaceae bacterium]
MSESDTKRKARETVFDVDVEKLARVYAQAVLDAASDVDGQAAVMDELQALVSEVLDRFPDFEQILASELISQDEKLEMIDRVFGGSLSATALSFLKVMGDHGRLGFLRQVVRSAQTVWAERNNRRNVRIELAQQAAPPLLQELVNKLQQSLGAEPVVTTVVNPDLIAGFVVRVGDRVYDASTRTSFERARSAMVARAIEAIQSRPEQFMEN